MREELESPEESYVECIKRKSLLRRQKEARLYRQVELDEEPKKGEE